MLSAGDAVFHGTAVRERFERVDPGTPDGPAWFSDSVDVASHFALMDDGTRPRVLRYRVVGDPALFVWTSRDDLAEIFGDDDDSAWRCKDTWTLAEAACDAGGYDGWIVPHNYPDGGADIMLCYPEQWLEFDGIEAT